MSMFSPRLPEDVSQRLDALATATGRTTSFLAGQAIRDFLEREVWRIAEIQQAIHEADADDFATDAETRAVAMKWKGHAD